MARVKRKEQSGSPDNDTDQSQKRMRQTPASPDAAESGPLVSFGKDVIRKIKETTDKRGQLISADFHVLPGKGLTEYYDLIKNPVALDTIESKLGTYKDVDEFMGDFVLMESNAHRFNKTSSTIAQYATKIKVMAQELVDGFKRTSTAEDTNGAGRRARSSTNSGLSYTAIREVLQAALKDITHEVKDKDGYSAASHFHSLPSKKQYPDYYEIIKRPICLNDIRKKLKTDEYSPDSIVDEFEDDMWQMFQNAATYNEPGSEIYEDAKVLETYFNPRIAEERKKLGKPPRVPPIMKSEDVTMTNGKDTVPRISLKLNNQKKAGSPLSVPDTSARPSKQTTAVASPAMSGMSPPPPLETRRNPFSAKATYSPMPSASTPSSMENSGSASPSLSSATMVQSASLPGSRPEDAAKSVANAPSQPKYCTFKLAAPLTENGLIMYKSFHDSLSHLRRPERTAKDSPIRKLQISSHPDLKPAIKFNTTVAPDKTNFATFNMYHIGADNTRMLIQPYFHKQIVSTRRGYGFWLRLNNTEIKPQMIPYPKDGVLCFWDLTLKPGQVNTIELICDMLTNPNAPPGEEDIERAVFWTGFNIV